MDFQQTGKAYLAIFNTKNPSVSRIQRRLKISYDRSKRLLDALEFLGAVSKPVNGQRKILWRQELDNKTD